MPASNRNTSLPAFALVMAALAIGPTAFAQPPSEKNDQILAELKAIRLLLEKLSANLGQPGNAPARAPGPVDTKVTLTGLGGPILGRPDAPLTMVEFTDLQCPYCRKFHSTAFEQIEKDYIVTGKLRYISRDFPLDAMHPFAQGALHATRCAGEQGKYWDIRHRILVNLAPLSADVFLALARELKLDEKAFKACVVEAPVKFQAEVQKDISDGTAAGVTGTPSFVIGLTRGDSLEGNRIVGAQPYAIFDAKLKELLAKVSVP